MAEKVKHTYELMFLVDSAVASASWDEVEATVKTILGRSDAEIISFNKWDERRLAYEVSGRKRGTYILCYCRVEPTLIGSIERDVQLNENLLRVLILNAEHMSEEAMQSLTPLMHREAAEVKSAEEAAERKAASEAKAKAKADSEKEGTGSAEASTAIVEPEVAISEESTGLELDSEVESGPEDDSGKEASEPEEQEPAKPSEAEDEQKPE